MGAGDDPYDGLDRFGRVQDLRWHKYSGTPADLVRIKHGYDRTSNRLWREDVVAAANSKDFDELYTYDGLYRLLTFKRGNLNTNKDDIASGTLSYDERQTFDPLGNWASLKRDAAGDGTFEIDQTRSHNKVNEITGITGGSWIVPAYDRNGNATTMPQPSPPQSGYTATYDAWNRLVKLVAGSNTEAEYAYDGNHRRTVIKNYTSGTLSETRHCYYTARWQCIEDRLGSSTSAERQFVWGLRYIDDLILRDRDTDANGSLDERLYCLQDANWNPVALVGTTGTVLARYAYGPYGRRSAYDATFTAATSTRDWETWMCGYRQDVTGTAGPVPVCASDVRGMKLREMGHHPVAFRIGRCRQTRNASLFGAAVH